VGVADVHLIGSEQEEHQSRYLGQYAQRIEYVCSTDIARRVLIAVEMNTNDFNYGQTVSMVRLAVFKSCY
jgi:hypothetical protein